MKLHLVKDWHDCWKWLSVHFLALSVALQFALLAMPADIRAYLPQPLTQTIAIVLLAAAFAGRITEQSPKKGNDDVQPDRVPVQPNGSPG
jgi:hypothetical protein